MNKYEGIFILDPRKVEDEGKAIAAEITALIERFNGSVTATELMGRKAFARSMKKRKAGSYVNLFFTMDPGKVIELRNKYRLDERMLRMMIIIDERPENYVAEPIVIQ